LFITGHIVLFVLNKTPHRKIKSTRERNITGNDNQNAINYQIRMETIISIVQIFAALAGCLAALMSILLFLRLHWPAAVLWFLKLYTSALSPILVLIGLFGLIVGLATGSEFITLIGIYVTLVFSIHIFRVKQTPNILAVFNNVSGHTHPSYSEQKNQFLPKRINLKLSLVPNQRLKQDIPFSTIPGTGRQLLCDIWQPPLNVIPSGLAYIYLHGGAWYFLDKDFSTRPFFNHLSSQGHVIMDVAYRLPPETDMMGMVHDVKRAIDWMKENSDRYGIDPDRIIIGGGSAGAHLALLAAYTANDQRFTPKELLANDINVCAVTSIYGQADLEACYYHTNQHLTAAEIPGKPKKKIPAKMPQWLIKSMGKDFHRLGMDKDLEKYGGLAPLLGGHPDEHSETYAMFSPLTHVHPGCPPTLMIHGEHDLLAPVTAIRFLHAHLMAEKVPSLLHILPQTDHGFDLVLPKISPSAHTAIYDVECFMALFRVRKQTVETFKTIPAVA
jgi:acetyl esterase/lipase